MVNKLYPRFLFSILISGIILFSYSSCKKNDSPQPDIPSTGSTLKTTIVGRITTVTGNSIAGATITVGSTQITTGNFGNFFIENINVSKERILVKSTKDGYFDCIKGMKTSKDGINYINLVMVPLPSPINLNSASGGTIYIPGGASIIFPSNAFVDNLGNAYNGNVNIYAHHLNVDVPGFEAMVPGGDFLGEDDQNNEQSLYSLGMLEVKLYGANMQPLNLATGKTAELHFPISSSQASEALSTIPLWYLDESTGVWKEEGTANKVGNNYVGTVNHFSTWNCDYMGERTDIKGKVVDCAQTPIPNIVVTINGFINVVTNNLGEYTTWVPAGYVIEAQVLTIYNPNLITNSNLVTITAAGGQVNVMPDIIVLCNSKAMGTLTNCSGSLTSGLLYHYNNSTGEFIQNYSTDGHFEIYANENENIILSAYSSSGYSSKNIFIPIGTTMYDCGNFTLCNTTGYGNYFTVDGDNYSNHEENIESVSSQSYPVDLNADSIPEGMYFHLTGNTSGYLKPGGIAFTMPAQSQGTYDLTPGNGAFYIDFNNKEYYTRFGDTLHLTLDNFGPPGTLINGTFHGTVSRVDSSTQQTRTINIHDGHLSIVRIN